MTLSTMQINELRNRGFVPDFNTAFFEQTRIMAMLLLESDDVTLLELPLSLLIKQDGPFVWCWLTREVFEKLLDDPRITNMAVVPNMDKWDLSTGKKIE